MSQSVARALELLNALERAPASLDELAASVGVHKTTVLRLLRTLEADRFVTHDAHHRYTLGSRLFELANGALEQRDIRGTARAELERLNASTGQTVHLATIEGDTVVYIDKLDALSGVRMYSRVGLPAPLHCTAVAKVLVAALPVPARERLAAGIDFVRLTPNTIADPPHYLAELETVARQGYAEDREEHEAFINCVAAPVRDGSGRTVAAVSVSVPRSALDYESVVALLPQVLAAAAAISAGLGWASTTTESSTPASGRALPKGTT